MNKFLVLALGLAMAACSKDPSLGVVAALKAGDWAKAELELEQGLAEHPDNKGLRVFRFVLYRHLTVHGQADQKQAYLSKAIIEYDALATALALKPDYADMEASLRSVPEGATLLAAARKPIYGE
jgi:hypothetical protein